MVMVMVMVMLIGDYFGRMWWSKRCDGGDNRWFWYRGSRENRIVAASQ